LPLTVTSRVENDIAILDLEGSLTLGPSLHNLRDTARQVLGKTRLSSIVLRVGGVTATDSAGLGELTVVYSLASTQGCKVALAEVSSSLRTMLEVTHLDGLFPIE
jgi:anti-anti-sigma factor